MKSKDVVPTEVVIVGSFRRNGVGVKLLSPFLVEKLNTGIELLCILSASLMLITNSHGLKANSRT